ncbi:MAG: cupredoxin domain-containing protein [Ectothiorhodospiraceae bacterium]|jgi:hypothetical protein
MKTAISAFLLAALLIPAAWAADLPTYRVELKDGKLDPANVKVKAGERFKLTVANTGSTPAEFESTDLRVEKVLAPGVTSFVVVHALKPGEYEYYDEFHLPDAKGTITAR